MSRHLKYRNLLLTVLWLPQAIVCAQPVVTDAKRTPAIVTSDALQQPLAFLTEVERAQFFRGRGLFNQVWMAASSDAQLEDVVFYQAALAVPAARNWDDPIVQQGKALFEQAGCQHCHLPELTSGANALVSEFANTTFNAYTDLLLHDMGNGLADGRPDHEAGSSEWRTAPLWGIGLLPVVSEHQTLLHDGRARGVLEAIMWHGDEAEAARARAQALSRSEREALISFVNSL